MRVIRRSCLKECVVDMNSNNWNKTFFLWIESFSELKLTDSTGHQIFLSCHIANTWNFETSNFTERIIDYLCTTPVASMYQKMRRRTYERLVLAPL